jgi:hypothetical protein
MSITGLASETRRATRMARTETARGKQGVQGTWTIDLGIAGLSEERRAELVARMNEHLGLKEGRKVDDGRLHSRCRANGMGFHGAAISGLVELDRMLREHGGLDYGKEILTSGMTFSVTPDEARDEPAATPRLPRGQRIAGKMFSKALPAKAVPGLLHVGYGIGVAASTEFDRGLRRLHGDRDYVIAGKVDGLEAVSADLIRRKAVEIGLGEEVVDSAIKCDDTFNMAVRTDGCGTAIGALLLFLHNTGRLFVVLPATASLTVDVDLLSGD